MRARLSAVCAVGLLVAVAGKALQAQTCYGTPPRGGAVFELGKVNFGKATGLSGALAGERFAFGAGFRSVSRGPQASGYEGDVRFSLVLGGGHLQVCPGLGFIFQHNKWDAPLGTLTSNGLAAWGGVGAGYEQKVWRDFNVIPFAGVRFAFNVVKYDFAATGSDVRTTGDTLSRGELQYGLLGRYKIVYAGYLVDHALKSSPPFLARWVLGLTLPVREE